jgi:hypothetical protein
MRVDQSQRRPGWLRCCCPVTPKGTAPTTFNTRRDHPEALSRRPAPGGEERSNHPRDDSAGQLGQKDHFRITTGVAFAYRLPGRIALTSRNRRIRKMTSGLSGATRDGPPPACHGAQVNSRRREGSTAAPTSGTNALHAARECVAEDYATTTDICGLFRMADLAGARVVAGMARTWLRPCRSDDVLLSHASCATPYLLPCPLSLDD